MEVLKCDRDVVMAAVTKDGFALHLAAKDWARAQGYCKGRGGGEKSGEICYSGTKKLPTSLNISQNV